MDIFLIIIWYIIFLMSTTFHEASHAFVAKLGGDLTAYHGGQVSLDPLPHIKREPLGMVVFPIIFLFLNGFPFGWASAPYDPYWARNNHKKAALMSLAGPMANLLLVILAGIGLKIGVEYGYFNYFAFEESIFGKSSYELSAWVKILSITFFMNLLLFVFNLVPLPGLDGSSAITYFMSRNTAASYMEKINNPAFSLLSLFLLWQIFPYIFFPVFKFAIRLLFL
ncbi:MAG: site-2 protease family protein [Candidatus Sericytochromatia bacterium]